MNQMEAGARVLSSRKDKTGLALGLINHIQPVLDHPVVFSQPDGAILVFRHSSGRQRLKTPQTKQRVLTTPSSRRYLRLVERP